MDGRHKIQAGRRYKVVEGSGLDSGRVGVGVPQSLALARQSWYKPVSFSGPFAVVLLKDERGYFAPFRSRVLPL